MNEIFNHLWQSTLFMAAVALACLVLRRHSPRLRYWIWLAASVKFLVPVAWLASLGASIELPPASPPLHAVTVQKISTYFAPLSAGSALYGTSALSPARVPMAWSVWLGALWFSGAAFLLYRWLREWRTLHAIARVAVRLPLDGAVPVFTSASTMEPGAFGLFRPVILLPDGIAGALPPEQLEAILAHELRHVEYRDNLTAALHMCVETLFWFYPAVWWIGARLMEERERDCDEAVLRQGSRPADYARSIVRICETYFESPLRCTAGISGSDLNKRIRAIMTWRGSLAMGRSGKVALAAAALSAVSLPFLIGLVRAQTLPPPPAYTYEVVSIRKTAPGAVNVHIGPGPQGGWVTENTSVMTLLSAAYDVQEYQIVGAPGWASSERFNITFTPDKNEVALAPGMAPKEIQASLRRNAQRLQAVLRDRFGLVLRAETRELPIYGLIEARGGNKLKLHADDKSGFPSIQTNGDRQITATNATMEMLAEQLGMELRRTVHNETALSGTYDLQLDWTPDPAAPPDSQTALPGPSIFTAITQQLGLKLESKRGPVHVYVVEKVERPTEN